MKIEAHTLLWTLIIVLVVLAVIKIVLPLALFVGACYVLYRVLLHHKENHEA